MRFQFEITVLSISAFLFAISICITETSAGPLKDQGNHDELVATQNCKDLCSSCGCLGFYCGAECLCECDGDGEDESEDGRCIERMQEHCERERLPYEVLIQGSNGNRLVRSLFVDAARAAGAAGTDDDQKVNGVCEAKDMLEREKRSTFSIYRPKKASEEALETEGDEQRRIEDNAATLRDVQTFLSEIGEELANELTKRGRFWAERRCAIRMLLYII